MRHIFAFRTPHSLFFVQVETQHLRDTSSDVGASNGDSTDDDWYMDTGNVKSTRNRDGGEGSDSSGDLKDIIRAQLPNFEIESIFRQWLLDHYAGFANPDNGSYIEMFQHMVSGSMALFAKGFLKLIWVTMPSQFLGSKECVYQAYVCAFMTAVGKGVGGWDVQVERSSGKGRLDLLLLCDDEAVIQEHKRIAMTKKDRGSGYGDSQRRRLSKEAEKGFSQIEARGYRARLPDRVTKLREFGIAFLGPYCAIVGRSLKRQPGGPWEFAKSYTTERNERHRSKLYTVSA